MNLRRIFEGTVASDFESGGWGDDATGTVAGGVDLVDRIIKGFKAEDEFVLLSRRHFVSPEGLEMDQFDYTTGGEFNSGIVAKVGDYLILFKCNAKSKADLEEMDRSAVGLRVVTAH